MSALKPHELSLQELIASGDAPTWLTQEGFRMLKGGYLLPDETPNQMWRRVSRSAAKYLGRPELEDKFFSLFWRNILCGATPVLSNMGTDRGLPISCNSIHVADKILSIFDKNTELAVLTKNGAGVGVYIGDIRARGKGIKGGGKGEGIVPWCKLYDTTISSVNQAGVRRGAAAVYLPVEHGDFDEFLRIRRPNNDTQNFCGFLHHGAVLSDDFMNKVVDGDVEARKMWVQIMKTRHETGEPYLMFSDNINRHNPQSYVNNGLTVKTSNICSEITLYTDDEHTFVCCLSSLNLARWNEFQDDDIYYSTIFLDAVLTEYIDKAQKSKEVEYLMPAIRSAIKGRAIGLGVLGWHTLLQEEGTPIDSFRANILNKAIFKKIQEESDKASKWLATEYGEPEWCKGTGFRNTHRLAIAPTASNSIISGGVSPGIEPIVANAWTEKTSKGAFMRKNSTLEKLLKELGKDEFDVWESIVERDGSVQHLDFLTEQQKEVFLTAFELDQSVLIRQAGDRQKYIDQAQSLNLFFTSDVSAKEFSGLHILAWRLGVKTLYYCRGSSVLKGDNANRANKVDATGNVIQAGDCKACEG